MMDMHMYIISQSIDRSTTQRAGGCFVLQRAGGISEFGEHTGNGFTKKKDIMRTQTQISTDRKQIKQTTLDSG